MPFKERIIPAVMRWLPLALVIGTALTVALLNIDWGAHYIGWDNVIPEFDIGRYARQVLGGAWLEHNGLGAAAGQAQLSEIFRLPAIWILSILVPDHLIRIVFIFTMYTIGGITMYLYLDRIWLQRLGVNARRWVAALGGILYLLHLLTLQQFYIAFEMFTVQFAFFPLVLLSIHSLARGINRKSLLFFIVVQLLIAPSAHTPTLLYLGAACAILYAGALQLVHGIRPALKLMAIVGGLTLIIHAYWIVPNLYYASGPSRAVTASRENVNFGPESLWAVHDAANVQNFLSGTHYLFRWQQYSFTEKKQVPVFGPWTAHLADPVISTLAACIGLLTLIGAVLTIFDRRKGTLRWAIVLIYAFSSLFIWMGFFPHWLVIDRILASKLLLEIFRNPFTKLSIIYSFVSVIFFIQTVEIAIYGLRRLILHRHTHIHRLVYKACVILLYITLLTMVIAVAWPTFTGGFINRALQVQLPTQYTKMFAYLKTRDENLRTMQLPQYRYVGWEYYDWSFLRPGNGYQGMGFYFFGMQQPYLMRDFDRWGETSDFYAHELKYALDNRDAKLFRQTLDKYNVDLVVVDETKIDPWTPADYEAEHRLALAAGLTPVWHVDFLTIYERKGADSGSALLAPEHLSEISTDARRVRVDEGYARYGDYVLDQSDKPKHIYPFAAALQREPANIAIVGDTATMTQQIPPGDYELSLPPQQQGTYKIPTYIRFANNTVDIVFPTYTLTIDGTETTLPKIDDVHFPTDDYPQIDVLIQNTLYSIKSGETIVAELTFDTKDTIDIGYVPTALNQSNNTPAISYTISTLKPDWAAILNPLTIKTRIEHELAFSSQFPQIPVDLAQNKPENCSYGGVGRISTTQTSEGYRYSADKYGVNCGGYSFKFLDFDYPYLLNVVGKNIFGRGIKLFINYRDPSIVSEEFIFPQQEFNKAITLPLISSQLKKRPILNWETRSGGGRSEAELSGINLVPFPIDALASLELQSTPNTQSVDNALTVREEQNVLDAVYSIDYDCAGTPCYLGLDQSYDPLWIGVNLSSFTLLPHFTYNSWANMWKVDHLKGTLYIVYAPQVMSYGLLVVCFIIIAILLLPKNRVLKLKRK